MFLKNISVNMRTFGKWIISSLLMKLKLKELNLSLILMAKETCCIVHLLRMGIQTVMVQFVKNVPSLILDIMLKGKNILDIYKNVSVVTFVNSNKNAWNKIGARENSERSKQTYSLDN